jgi:hypothetical protein
LEERLEEIWFLRRKMTENMTQKAMQDRAKARRIERKQLKFAARNSFPDKDYEKMFAKWERKLDREGWQHSVSGWSKDGVGPLPTEEAIIVRNRERREYKAGFDERAEAYLLNKGWECGGPNGDVWSRPNWEVDDGRCYRSLRRAYRIQVGLDSESSQTP